MNSLIYSEKLQDPHWQRKRLEILSRDKFTCQLCQDTETTLHVHHKEYLKGHQPWEYPDDNFQTLCKHCHNALETCKSSIISAMSVKKIKKAGVEGYILAMIALNINDELVLIFFEFEDDIINPLFGLKSSSFKDIGGLLKGAEKLITKNL